MVPFSLSVKKKSVFTAIPAHYLCHAFYDRQVTIQDEWNASQYASA
jgi:hypothetical protein